MNRAFAPCLLLTIALSACGHATKTPAAASYAFDSRYEVNRAEAALHEAVLKKEMAVGRFPGHAGGELALRAGHCAISPPPPAAHRMLCTTVTVAKEVRSRTSVRRYYTRKATVTIDPASGTVRFRIATASPSSALVTP